MSDHIPKPLRCIIKNPDTKKEVRAKFNPKELTIEKSVPWNKHKDSKGDTPLLEFTDAEPKTMTVVMSLTDLVEIVRVAAKRQPFGEALDAAGFRPAAGKKMAVRPGFPQEPLVWRRFKKPGNE